MIESHLPLPEQALKEVEEGFFVFLKSEAVIVLTP
jgi:hypothetical protein